jgi:hypothetical protein
MSGTMTWHFEGRLFVVVHGPRDPSNLEWQRMLKEEVERGRGQPMCTLVVSYGGSPNGEQRKLLERQMDHNSGPTCVMTKSTIVKAIAAALLFFNRRLKVVGLDENAEAYSFLGLSAAERALADRVRRQCELELGLASGGSLTLPPTREP